MALTNPQRMTTREAYIALADVPDHEHGWSCGENNRLRQRAEAAEAKLAKVREWRNSRFLYWAELDNILDEED